MVTVEASGSQLTDGTEQTLATIVTPRVLLLVIDLDVMTDAGDIIVLRAKRKVLTGSASAQIYFAATFEGVDGGFPGETVQISIPMPTPFEGIFTIERTAGADRTYEWSVESI